MATWGSPWTAPGNYQWLSTPTGTSSKWRMDKFRMSPLSMSPRNCSTNNPAIILFQGLWNVPWCMDSLLLNKDSSRPLHRFMELFFLYSLFYSRILLHNFKLFQCPKFWSPQLTNADRLCSVFTCFSHLRAHLIYFSFLSDQSPVMVFAQHLKTISYILSSFLDGGGQV